MYDRNLPPANMLIHSYLNLTKKWMWSFHLFFFKMNCDYPVTSCIYLCLCPVVYFSHNIINYPPMGCHFPVASAYEVFIYLNQCDISGWVHHTWISWIKDCYWCVNCTQLDWINFRGLTVLTLNWLIASQCLTQRWLWVCLYCRYLLSFFLHRLRHLQ